MDPSMMNGMEGMNVMGDPADMISLYKATSAKNKRKILMQKAGGAFGGKKSQSSDKYTFSVKKIREGYWELVIDKPLPRGEYAFSMIGMGMGKEHRIDPFQSKCQCLQAQFRGRVDEQMQTIPHQIGRGAIAEIAWIGRGANRTIATDHGHTIRGAGAEEGEAHPATRSRS